MEGKKKIKSKHVIIRPKKKNEKGVIVNTLPPPQLLNIKGSYIYTTNTV